MSAPAAIRIRRDAPWVSDDSEIRQVQGATGGNLEDDSITQFVAEPGQETTNSPCALAMEVMDKRGSSEAEVEWAAMSQQMHPANNSRGFIAPNLESLAPIGK